MSKKREEKRTRVDALMPRPSPEAWKAEEKVRSDFRKAARHAASFAAREILLDWLKADAIKFISQDTGYDRRQGLVHVRTVYRAFVPRDRMLDALIGDLREAFCSVSPRTNFDGTTFTLDHYWRIEPKPDRKAIRKATPRATYIATACTKDVQSFATRPVEFSLIGSYSDELDAKAQEIGERIFLSNTSRAERRRKQVQIKDVKREDLRVLVLRTNTRPVENKMPE